MLNTINEKTLRRQQLYGRNKTIAQTIEEQSSSFVTSDENRELLLCCERDWDSLSSVRSERKRNLRYKNGDQWGDLIYDPKSKKWMREDQYLSLQGKVPLKRNFIQQFVRNLHGQLLQNKAQTIVHARTKDDSELGEMLTNAINACHKLNKTDKLNISVLEDLLMCGMACTKSRYGFFSEKNRADGKIDLVNIGRLFFNTDVEDPRMGDLRRIGEIHDYTMADLVANFAINKADEVTLRELYGRILRDSDSLNKSMSAEKSPQSFLISDDYSKCRVIEVWEKKGRWVTYCHDYADGTEQITMMSKAQIELINSERIATGLSVGMSADKIALIYAEPRYEYYWIAKYLTPNGVCIKEFETPFTHESHPYTLATMPMVDGSIKSVLGDLIDIQRNINRLMVLKDAMMNSSAKGVKLIPEECIPENMTIDEFNDQWKSPNGMVVYRASKMPNVAPQQVAINNSDNGTSATLQLELNLMQQISGISSAIQGETPRANTPSSLYAQQAQNSTLNYRILFDVFFSFVEDRDEKLLKVLMQFYSDRRYVDISGDAYKDVAKFYDPQMAQKVVDFNLVVTQGLNTPVYRQIADDMLLDFLKSGFINFEMFLDNSSLPFAEKLRAELKQAQEAMAQQQQQAAAMAGGAKSRAQRNAPTQAEQGSQSISPEMLSAMMG